MLDRLFDYVGELPTEQAVQLSLQDVALCRLWLGALDGLDLRDQAAAVRERVEYWLGNSKPSIPETEGRRYQILLRAGIDALLEGKHQELESDEVALLFACGELAGESINAEAFARVCEMIAPHAGGLRELRATLAPGHDLPNLAKRLRIITEEDVKAAPQRSTRLLAGIELPCHGPVFKHEGDLQIIGDVPDNCTVVVSEGGCCVGGYVMGRVLTKRFCEVRGNISGAVIALHGDVRARSVINNAHIVTKMGDVICRTAQGPRLIFAGNQIAITGSAMLGRFISRVMEIRGEVRGGEIHVSDTVQAQRFRHSGANTLCIILRSELSCQDYGEITGAELRRLLSEAYRLRQMARNFQTVAGLNADEAEHTATTLLMHVFGGGETQKALEEVVVAQQRLDTLRRLIANLEAIRDKAREDLRLQGKRQDVAADSKAFGKDDIPFVEGVDADEDLAQESAAVHELQVSVTSRRLSHTQTRAVLAEVREKLGRLADECGRLEETIAQLEKSVHASSQYEHILGNVERDAAKLDILERILPTLKEQLPGSPIAKRMASSFFDLGLRTVNTRLRHVAEYQARADEYSANFKTVSTKLGEDFQIKILDSNEEENDVIRAMGRFEAGVKIFSGLDAFEEDDPPEGACIVTSAGTDDVQVFVRSRGGGQFHMLHK